MPAYTYRATGTVSYLSDTDSGDLTPGAPAGKASGDLLILTTIQRTVSQTLDTALTGWTLLHSKNDDTVSVFIYGRIADGTGTDTPSVSWTTGSTGDIAAWITAFYGDVHTTLASIVVHSGEATPSNTVSVLALPGLTVTTDNTLLYAFTMRLKSATSDDTTTITASPEFTKSMQYIDPGNASMMFADGYWQQTTATSYDGDDWTRDGTDENLATYGVILSLQTNAATTTKYLKALLHPSAIGATDLEGIVYAAPSDSPLDVCGAEIGEFGVGSPQYTFVDGSGLSPATDAGYAVLKIPVTAFGGDALTTSDTPLLVVRNASYTSGLISCTVVEE